MTTKYQRLEAALLDMMADARPGDTIRDWVIVVGTESDESSMGTISMCERDEQHPAITSELLGRAIAAVSRKQLDRETEVATPDNPR